MCLPPFFQQLENDLRQFLTKVACCRFESQTKCDVILLLVAYYAPCMTVSNCSGGIKGVSPVPYDCTCALYSTQL